MSDNLSLKSLLSVLGLAAITTGLWYSSPVNALGNKGGSLFGAAEDINLVIECTWERFSGEFTADPGNTAAPTPPQVTEDVPLAHCVGWKADSLREGSKVPYTGTNNSGDFHLTVKYILALCASDNNRGHGNEVCTQLDPDNTGNGGTQISPGRSGVQCTAVNPYDAGQGSLLTYKAYCEEGVVVDESKSFLKYVGTVEPPVWTNCTSGNADCTLVLGGLPHTKKGKALVVDTKRCDELFPAAVGFESSQLLSYQEWYPGVCVDAHTPPNTDAVEPLAGRARYCDSGFGTDWGDGDAVNPDVAGLDNTFRECPSTISMVTGETVNHTASYSIESFQYEISATFNPQSYNLNSCPDNGVVSVNFSTQSGLDVNRIAGLDPMMPDGISSVAFAPKLTPFEAESNLNEPGYGIVLSVPLERAQFNDIDFDGIYESVKLTYKTCRDDNLGLTQILETYHDDGMEIIVTEAGGKQHIDVTVQGMTAPTAGVTEGTEFGAFDYDHKVVVPF